MRAVESARSGFVKRTISRVVGLVVVLLFLGAWAHAPLLTWMGDYLVVEDTLEPAAAIVVTGGQTPFRAMEAARLYHEGWATHVMLARSYLWPEERTLEALGVYKPQEWEINREVLIRMGVPPSAIQVLKERPRNSEEEIMAVIRAFQGASQPVVIITSKYHTRRLHVLWKKLAVNGSPRLIVRATRDDPFDPSAWWLDRRFALAVAREYLGLLHIWAGSPIGYQSE